MIERSFSCQRISKVRHRTIERAFELSSEATFASELRNANGLHARPDFVPPLAPILNVLYDRIISYKKVGDHVSNVGIPESDTPAACYIADSSISCDNQNAFLDIQVVFH